MTNSSQSDKGKNNLQSSAQQGEQRQCENPGQKHEGSPSREELKRLSSYVLEEIKKIKVSFPLYELMKISEIGDTLLESFNDAPTKIVSQNVSHPSRGVSNVQEYNFAQNSNVANDVSPYASKLSQNRSSFIGMVQNS